jgi:NAD(P)H-flavin reductase
MIGRASSLAELEDELSEPDKRGKNIQAQIKEKREVAKGTLLVIFDLLGEEVDFTPGQYFFVTLPDVATRTRRDCAGTSRS